MRELVIPDDRLWERWEREGNPCAFGTRGWLGLMAACGRGEVRWLTSDGLRAAGIYLPCLLTETGGDGFEVAASTDWYYATPIGATECSAELMREIVSAAGELGATRVHWALPPWDGPAGEAGPAPMTGVSYHRGVAYVIHMEADAEATLARRLNDTMGKKVRRNHRRGVDVGLAANAGEERAHYELYQRLHREHGWGGWERPWSFYTEFGGCMNSRGDLVVVRYKGRVIGGAVLLYDAAAVHVFHAYGDHAVRDAYPMCALLEYAIRQAERRSVARVNLGGVNQGNDGLAQFKLAWGAEPCGYWSIGIVGAAQIRDESPWTLRRLAAGAIRRAKSHAVRLGLAGV